MRRSRGRATVCLLAGLAVAGAAVAYEPRVNYQLQCQGCHHPDAAGEPGRVPSTRTTLVSFSAIPEGRDFVMRVPGVAQAPLSDAELATLLNWMARNLSDVPAGPGFVEYTAAEVGAARHRPLVAVQPLRQELMERLGIH